MPVEELEITAHGFLASQLSEHIREMDDGSLVVEDCPVARTGFQEYAVKDLPQEAARDLGVDMSVPSAGIDLYRPAEEVFRPEFLASLEGRPVVDGHPPGFVTPETFSRYAKGHVQNVRRGEPMDDGETPVIADLVISGEPLVSKVRNKTARDVSLGYDFSIRKDGNRIVQCDMAANHAAIVPKGRAGDLVAIGDEAPAPNESPPAVIAPSAGREQGTATSETSTAASTTKKEIKPVANVLKNLRGRMLKAFAVDAEPEDVAEAAEVLNQAPPAEADDKKKTKDVKAKDDGSPDEPEEDDLKDVEDKRPKARDRKKAKDSHRQRMHDALDRMLDAEGEGEGEKEEADDTDLDELKALLGQFFSEEKTEPAHAAEDEPDTKPLDDVLGCGAEPMAEDGTVEEEQLPEEVDDLAVEAEEPDGEEDLEEADDKKSAKDRARAADGAAAVLTVLRPFVARCGDSKMQTAFNTALRSVRRGSRASSGSHAAFDAAAKARSKAPANAARARVGDAGSDPIARLQSAYTQAHHGGSKEGGK